MKPSGLRRPLVAIVADDGGRVLDVAALLDQYDYRVAQVVDEQRAARLAPDLILIEAGSSLRAALARCRQIKAQAGTRGIPVILMATLQSPTDREAVFAAGAADYVSRPLLDAELLARVRACVGRRQTAPGAGDGAAGDEAALLAAAFDQLHETIYLLDAEANIRYANEAGCRRLGYTSEEIVGLPMSRIDPLVTADWWWYGWPEFLLKRFVLLEGTHYCKDGRSFPVHVRAHLVQFDGKDFSLCLARDITDRKLTDRELMLNHALNQSTEAAFVMDATGRLRYVNDAACRHLGYSREELLGKQVPDFDVDIPADTFAAMLASVLVRGPTRGTIRSRHRRRDGSLVPVEINASVFDSEGLRFVLTLVRDISERLAAEQSLHAGEQVFRALVENSPDFVARYDRDCRRLYVNPAAAAITGRSVAEMLGTTPLDNGALCDPNGFVDRLRRAFDLGQPQRFEARYRHHAHVDARWGDVRIVPELDREGRVATVLAISRDINQLKESERRFRTLAENLPDNVIRLDRQGRLTYANPRMQETWRAWGLQVATGRTFVETCGDSDAQACHLRYLQAMERRESLEFDQMVASFGEGERLHNIAVVPEFDDTGDVVGVLAIGRDVTERRRAEAQLRDLNRALKAIDDCRRALIRARDEATLLTDICRIVCDEAGYRMAWIGYPGAGEAAGVTPVAWAGAEDGYLECVTPVWNGVNKVHDPTCIVLGAGHSSVVDDYATDPAVAAWREEALRRGYRSRIAVPLRDGHGRAFGVLSVYAAIPGAFNAEEVRLVQGLADDLAFGVLALRARLRQREADAGLLASEQRFRSLVENLPDLVVRYDRELRRTYVNPAWERAAGLSSTEVVARAIEATPLVPNPAIDRYVESLRNALDKGTRQDVEFTWTNARGETLYLQYAVVPEFGPLGEPIGLLAVGRDLTARRLADEKARAHMRFLENMDRIDRTIRSAEDIDRLLEQVLDETLSILDCDRAFLLYPCDPDAPEWTVPMERWRPEYPGARSVESVIRRDERVAGIHRALLAADGPLVFDGNSEPDCAGMAADSANRYRIRSSMSMALRPKLRLAWQIGVHQCSHVRTWTDDELDLLNAIGRRLTDGLTAMISKRDLHESHEMLRELAARRETAREEEKRHMAREIHDELGQQMTALRMGISALAVEFTDSPPIFRERVQRLVDLSDRAIKEVRNIATALRPAVLDSGIAPAMEWLVAGFRNQTGIACRAMVAESLPILDETHAIVLFRIAQESLTNVARHSMGRSVDVSLSYRDQTLLLEISDDGCGFDPDHAHRQSFGLAGMRERALLLGGEIVIESSPGTGTTVRLTLPMAVADAGGTVGAS